MGLVAVDDVVVSGHNSVAVGLAFLLAESPSLFKLSVVVKIKKKKVQNWFQNLLTKLLEVGWEPWPSDYGRTLTSKRSWVQISAPDTGWNFSHKYCSKNCNVLFEKTENKQKRLGLVHIKK